MAIFGTKRHTDKGEPGQEISPSISQAAGSDNEKCASQTGEDDPLARLETSQREALLAQIDTPQKKSVSYFGLMRYASTTDRILQLIGVITCIAAGAALVSLNHLHKCFSSTS